MSSQCAGQSGVDVAISTMIEFDLKRLDLLITSQEGRALFPNKDVADQKRGELETHWDNLGIPKNLKCVVTFFLAGTSSSVLTLTRLLRPLVAKTLRNPKIVYLIRASSCPRMRTRVPTRRSASERCWASGAVLWSGSALLRPASKCASRTRRQEQERQPDHSVGSAGHAEFGINSQLCATR